MAKILVVDDEKSIRVTLSAFLSAESHQVMQASHFDEAIQLIKKNDFNLIFTDIILEQHSGIEILKIARHQHPNISIVLITGYPNIDTATDALRLGAFDYVSKPILKDGLLKVANLALDRNEILLQKEKDLKDYYIEKNNYIRQLQECKTTIDSLEKILASKSPNQTEKAILDHNLTEVSLPQHGLELEKLNQNIVLKALELNEQNKVHTANYLNITRDVLRSKLKHIY